MRVGGKGLRVTGCTVSMLVYAETFSPLVCLFVCLFVCLLGSGFFLVRGPPAWHLAALAPITAFGHCNGPLHRYVRACWLGFRCFVGSPLFGSAGVEVSVLFFRCWVWSSPSVCSTIPLPSFGPGHLWVVGLVLLFGGSPPPLQPKHPL